MNMGKKLYFVKYHKCFLYDEIVIYTWKFVSGAQLCGEGGRKVVCCWKKSYNLEINLEMRKLIPLAADNLAKNVQTFSHSFQWLWLGFEFERNELSPIRKINPSHKRYWN